jgi:hypothetical protein
LQPPTTLLSSLMVPTYSSPYYCSYNQQTSLLRAPQQRMQATRINSPSALKTGRLLLSPTRLWSQLLLPAFRYRWLANATMQVKMEAMNKAVLDGLRFSQVLTLSMDKC